MTDISVMTVAGSSLAALAIAAVAALRGWRGWLEVKRLELTGATGGEGRGSAAERIEVADLKERIRKLEAIAACIDL
jgi:hypothetical protein